jgi:hypothetical protein
MDVCFCHVDTCLGSVLKEIPKGLLQHHMPPPASATTGWPLGIGHWADLCTSAPTSALRSLVGGAWCGGAGAALPCALPCAGVLAAAGAGALTARISHITYLYSSIFIASDLEQFAVPNSKQQAGVFKN